MKGVLLMAYGTPRNLDEVEAFYTHIRAGRTPSPQLLASLRARYEAIGGRTPLLDVSEAQAEALEARLGSDYRVFVGMRHWHPFIPEATAAMAEAGIRDAVAMALTPQFSSLSVGAYLQAATEAAGPISFRQVRSWYSQRAYLDAMSEVIQSASTHDWKPDMVVFTAHSLPRHSVEEGDPYVFQLQQTARMLAQQLDLPRWIMSFQSAPQGGDIRRDAWLGPDILQTIDSLATDGVSRILVAPIGFISDHLEVLYDIDVQARRHADGLGVEMRRTESLNTHPKLIEALADAVLEAV